MKLLVFTQKVDKNDPVLGFFHHWLEVFASHFEKITVICLGKGEYSLPANVKVLSLGKEEGISKAASLWRFYKYIWRERKDYDAVFVHMNQEYVILGWKSWFLMGKKIYMWRNHAHGNFLTWLAVALSHKVFYTSPSSYTARFKKSVKMPVGIDTDFFSPDPSVERKPNSVLFLGRIGPVKRVLEFVEWFNILEPKFTATLAGAALPRDKAYEEEVRERASDRITFVGPVTQEGARKLYQRHEIYVNKTDSFDKTVFEAAASEMKLIVDNPDLKTLEGKSGRELREFVVSHHSLKLLAEKLAQELSR